MPKAGGYATRTSVSPCAGAAIPPDLRSLLARTSAAQPGTVSPLPIATSVPAMFRTIMRPIFYLLAALAGLVTAPTATAAIDRYDVSYLWHRDIDSVRDYRDRVARVF